MSMVPRRILRLPLLLLSVLVVACGPGVDSVDALCRASSSCQTPPVGECVAGVFKGYRTPGSCNVEDGRCSYEVEEVPCEFGCFDALRCKGLGDPLWQLDEVTGDLQGRGQLLAVGPDDTLYGIGNKKHLWAVSPDGVLKWSVQLGEAGDVPYNRTTPAIDSAGNIYLGVRMVGSASLDGWVYGVSPKGEVRWRVLERGDVFTQAFTATPAIDQDDFLYWSHSFDLGKFSSEGKIIWSSQSLWAMPVISAEGHLFLSYLSKLVSTTKDGEERWNVDLLLSAPTTSDDMAALLIWPVVRPDGVLCMHLRDDEADASILVGVSP
ncbi:MAG: PQQ-like beta-propeller repeat protein, partial [Deltaproteobacteria bacterium]|nr:PQQ-like beta-propeller repeat protein [Deltaproteobacteria bacterium]